MCPSRADLSGFGACPDISPFLRPDGGSETPGVLPQSPVPRQHLSPSPRAALHKGSPQRLRPAVPTQQHDVRVRPVLISGGNGLVLSQDMETPASKCSWETCLVTSSRRDVPEFKCSLSCFQLQLRQRLCEPGSHNVTGTAGQHHPQLRCWGPRLVAPFPCGRGTTRPGTLGKHRRTPKSSQLLSPSPSPSPCPALCPSPSSIAPLALPPLPRDIFPARAESTFPNNAPGRAQRAGKASSVPRGVQDPVPPALPLAPRCPGAEAALTLILCRRRLGLLALSRRLAAVRSQVLLGVHKNQHLGGGGGELQVPAISAGGAGERGGEGE